MTLEIHIYIYIFITPLLGTRLDSLSTSQPLLEKLSNSLDQQLSEYATKQKTTKQNQHVHTQLVYTIVFIANKIELASSASLWLID
jgi:hypothetical protein